MRFVVPIVLALVGVIHLLPLSGVLGGERLVALYGVATDEPALALLMQHRALLFGLLGAFMLRAAFLPAWHAAALLAGSISVLSFLVLAMLAGELNPQIVRVVAVDVGALAGLVIGGIVHRWRPAS